MPLRRPRHRPDRRHNQPRTDVSGCGGPSVEGTPAKIVTGQGLRESCSSSASRDHDLTTTVPESGSACEHPGPSPGNATRSEKPSRLTAGREEYERTGSTSSVVEHELGQFSMRAPPGNLIRRGEPYRFHRTDSACRRTMSATRPRTFLLRSRWPLSGATRPDGRFVNVEPQSRTAYRRDSPIGWPQR